MSGTLKRGPISFNVAREERNKKKRERAYEKKQRKPKQ